MADPICNDAAWIRRMEFLSVFLELTLENQLAFMAEAAKMIAAEHSNQLQFLLWQVQLADHVALSGP